MGMDAGQPGQPQQQPAPAPPSVLPPWGQDQYGQQPQPRQQPGQDANVGSLDKTAQQIPMITMKLLQHLGQLGPAQGPQGQG